VQPDVDERRKLMEEPKSFWRKVLVAVPNELRLP
jgi:hypothetical protein